MSIDGKIFKDLSTDELRNKLEIVFIPEKQKNEKDIQEQSDSKNSVTSDSDSDMVSDKDLTI